MGTFTRVVHFCDVHIQPERRAFEQTVAAVRSALALDPSPSAVLYGGDLVMNAVSSDEARAQEQFELWMKATEGFRDLPQYPCLGNSDHWGFSQSASGTTGHEPRYGKGWVLELYGLESPYYEARIGSWRLIVLDSIRRGGKQGYYAALDEQQMEWLLARLAEDTESPTVIMGHVPVVPSPASFYGMDVREPHAEWEWRLPAHQIHVDGFEISELLGRYDNVKLYLNGHTHCVDCVQYKGVSYLSAPAVCGAWWRGPFLGTPPAFTIVDLYPDGRFETSFEEVQQFAEMLES